MKSMKLSAVVLGLAAASIFAAPAAAPAAAAPAAAPAAEAPKAEAPKAEAAAPAAAPAAEAPKAEEAKAEAAAPAAAPAAEAPKAEEAKAEAAPAAAPAAEAPKAEEAKAEAAAPAAAPAAEAPKAEEAKAEAAAEPSAEEESLEFTISGEVEVDAYAYGYNSHRRFKHSLSSTFDLNFDVKFNENWSAFVGIEGDDLNSNPDIYFNGAYVQYANSLLAVKLGDMTYSEGALNYYRFDDPAVAAVGMVEQNMRGVELSIKGLQVAVGFSADEGTADYMTPYATEDAAYFGHIAYDFEFAGQKVRPFVDYKGYDFGDVNKLHAGVDMNFSILNLLDIHAIYAMSDDMAFKAEPVVSHSFAIEPTLTKGIFSLTGSVFYALLADNLDRASAIDMPERFYIYAEPSIQFTESFKVGIMGEYHTNTLDKDNDENEFGYCGPKIYFNPTKNISMDVFGAIILPLGDGDGTGTLINYKKDDEYLFDAGAEVLFNF